MDQGTQQPNQPENISGYDPSKINIIINNTSNNPAGPVGGLSPKSRATFIVLAIFFGALGLHRFYAGYTKVGVIYLLITICSLGSLAFIIGIIGLVECFTVTTDKQGRRLH